LLSELLLVQESIKLKKVIKLKDRNAIFQWGSSGAFSPADSIPADMPPIIKLDRELLNAVIL
jgi:hypothetical protein